MTVILVLAYIALAVFSEKSGKTKLFINIYGITAGLGFVLFGLSFILKKFISPGDSLVPENSAPDDIFWQILLPVYALFILIGIAAVFVAYSRESKLNSVLRFLCVVMSPVFSIFMILLSFIATGLQYMTSITLASIGSLGLSAAIKVLDYVRLKLKDKKA